MERLKPGQRIKLFDGYDMDPPWLKGRDCYYAEVIRFFDNRIEKRTGDERLSAVIQFDDEIEFEGLTGTYGVITGRWEGQRWKTSGVVHVYLLKSEIHDASEITADNSCWMESHASYEKVDDRQV